MPLPSSPRSCSTGTTSQSDEPASPPVLTSQPDRNSPNNNLTFTRSYLSGEAAGNYLASTATSSDNQEQLQFREATDALVAEAKELRRVQNNPGQLNPRETLNPSKTAAFGTQVATQTSNSSTSFGRARAGTLKSGSFTSSYKSRVGQSPLWKTRTPQKINWRQRNNPSSAPAMPGQRTVHSQELSPSDSRRYTTEPQEEDGDDEVDLLPSRLARDESSADEYTAIFPDRNRRTGGYGSMQRDREAEESPVSPYEAETEEELPSGLDNGNEGSSTNSKRRRSPASTIKNPPSRKATTKRTTPAAAGASSRPDSNDEQDQPEGREGWWKRFLDKYGSVELENKGSVARDHLALERTFLAWLRTSLSFASIGIAVTQLFRLNTSLESHDHQSTDQARLPSSGDIYNPTTAASPLVRNETPPGLDRETLRQVGKPLGATFIGISILILLIGFHRYFESQHYVIRGKFPASRGSIFLVTLMAGALIVTSLVIVVTVAKGAIET